ncbi:MAG: M3 family metallopeptidase, partial [Acidobacteriota bacterium]
MKKTFLLILISGLLVFSCAKEEIPSAEAENPFFSEFDTPFGTPPFQVITEEHYKPALTEGIQKHKEEIQAIIENPEPPTFQNTVEALDRSGSLLIRTRNVFQNMLSAHTSDSLQSIAEEMSPYLSQHYDDIYLNKKLFQRLKTVYEQRKDLDLTQEQKKLLEDYYKDFIRSGVELNEEKKERLREINKELSLLSLKYGENVLKETNSFEMIIDNEEDLAGLPQNVIRAAAETAKEKGYADKWVFTLHKPSWIPFLQYSPRRQLREKIFKAYINLGNNNNQYDNKANAAKMAALRLERANLLGYPSHAHYVLEENMAKNPKNVYEFLNQVWEPALQKAKEEAQELQKMIDQEKGDFKLQPWDWWYYAEKLKKTKYDLDEEMLRPYFKLENVLQGVFTLTNKLYGLQFVERNDIPIYHPEVKVFEVKEADGSHIGILYTDYFPRASKRGGAWMNSFRKQYRINSEKVSPLICNVGNFSKPTSDTPSLLSFDEVNTLFHEFGHALHGLLSDCSYRKLSGTSVPRDFVELPSQIMENWVKEPEMLKLFARHYQTEEVIPQEFIEKMNRAQYFNQGFATVEYLAAAFLDMDWHTLQEPLKKEVMAFEEDCLQKMGLIPEIIVRYRSTYFNHIFSGGYSAGYYSYIWSEVLDADAFQAFKESG